MMLLYSSTFLTANVVDTLYSSLPNDEAKPTTSGLTKFAAVSSVILSLSLYKDSQFARIFGTGSARRLPPASYAIFTARDCLTIFASFNLPRLIAPMLPEWSNGTMSRLAVAQLMAPALMQPVCTPLHLLGLDLMNQNARTPLRQRMGKVWLDWPSASLARMCRVIPPLGLAML